MLYLAPLIRWRPAQRVRVEYQRIRAMDRNELEWLFWRLHCAREAAYSKEGLWPPRLHRELVKTIEDLNWRLTKEFPLAADALK